MQKKIRKLMFIPKHGGERNISFICARRDDKANIIQNKNRGNLRVKKFDEIMSDSLLWIAACDLKLIE